MLTMERQIGTVQRPKPVSFRGITAGITTNKTEAQEITNQTTSRTTTALLVMPATNLVGESASTQREHMCTHTGKVSRSGVRIH